MFKIKVDRLVEPSSPAYLHVGSEVNFIIPSSKIQQLNSGSLDFKWQSDDSSVLEVISQSGSSMKAKAKSPGSADVKFNGQVVSTAVVAKIESARVHIDSVDPVFDISKGRQTKKIKLRLDQNDIRPIYSHDGRQIIVQNVDIKCNSDHEFIKAVGVFNSESFFCELTYTGPSKASSNQLPNKAQIDVSAGGKIGNDLYTH